MSYDISDLPGFKKKVWVDPTAAATVFSFADLANQYYITYDNRKKDVFFVQWLEPESPSQKSNGSGTFLKYLGLLL